MSKAEGLAGDTLSTLGALSEGYRYRERHGLFRQGADSGFVISQLKRSKREKRVR